MPFKNHIQFAMGCDLTYPTPHLSCLYISDLWFKNTWHVLLAYAIIRCCFHVRNCKWNYICRREVVLCGQQGGTPNERIIFCSQGQTNSCASITFECKYKYKAALLFLNVMQVPKLGSKYKSLLIPFILIGTNSRNNGIDGRY